MSEHINDKNANSSDREKYNKEAVVNKSNDEGKSRSLIITLLKYVNKVIEENKVLFNISSAVLFALAIVCWYFFCQGYYVDYYGLSTNVVSAIMFDFNFELILQCVALLVSSLLIVVSVLLISNLLVSKKWENTIIAVVIGEMMFMLLVYILYAFCIGENLNAINSVLLSNFYIICSISILLIIAAIKCVIIFASWINKKSLDRELKSQALSKLHFVKIDDVLSKTFKTDIVNYCNNMNLDKIAIIPGCEIMNDNSSVEMIDCVNIVGSDTLYLAYKDSINQNAERKTKDLNKIEHLHWTAALTGLILIILIVFLPAVRTLGNGVAKIKQNYELLPKEQVDTTIFTGEKFDYFTVIYSGSDNLICAPVSISCNSGLETLVIKNTYTFYLTKNDYYVVNRDFSQVIIE